MTASVDRQYHGLQNNGINGAVHSVFSNHNGRSNSPIPGFNFNSPNTPFKKPQLNRDHYSSSDDDDDDDDDNEAREKMDEYNTLIIRGKNELEPLIRDSRDEGTADAWIERNHSLIRLTGKHPFNSEPPLTRLMHYGFITPVPLHYVRNHGAVPNAKWEEWTVEVSGLVKKPMKFTMEQLVNEFESREFPVTLVCAGNRRKEQNMVKQTIGFNWGAAAISTTVWRGVPLREVLKRCGIMSSKKGAMNVCFEGAEELPGGGGSKYGTSVNKGVAMDPARDIMLAYMQNGERLTPDHGFPVRLIIPGFIGGRMVKWLKRIMVTTAESENYYHYKDNRVLPSHVDAELANSEAWWYKPEYIINEVNINSVITTPCHDEILPINSWTTQRPYTMRGYAYSGGGRKVIRVEVTLDGGETWRLCEMEHPERPSRYGKHWCWCFWSVEVEVLDLLSAKEVAVRAWDESLNTQPDKLIWNVMGMMNNCWFRVKTSMCKPHRGEIGIVFEHPTQPANNPSGWMAREKHLEVSDSGGAHAMKRTTSTPVMNTSSKTYSMSEVRKHDSADSAWLIVHGHVYDATKFLKDHPGGSDSILINAGTDCSEEFDAIHSDKAKKLLEDYRIGELVTTANSAASSPGNSVHGGSNVALLPPIKEVVVGALKPREKIPCKLIEKVSLSHDVRKFRFGLPSEDHVLGLPVGKHIFLCATIDGKLCMRGYTPTTTVDVVGYFDLVVKIYFKDVHPKFPNGGLMSQYLDSIPLGSIIDVKGPMGHIEYTGRGNFMVHGIKPKLAKKLAMISGGTGITPIYQVMQAILKDPEDETEMYVVYANRTVEDILLRDELDKWAQEYKEKVKVWYVVERASEGWQYDVGFITEKILRDHLPESGNDVLALTCGPPPMIQFAVQPNLEKMGYDIKEQLLIF